MKISVLIFFLSLACIAQAAEVRKTPTPQQALNQAFWNAAKSNNIPLLRELLQRNPPPYIDVQDGRGRTALMVAVQNNNIDVVNVLIGAGADVAIKNNAGKTAFDYAQNNPLLEQALQPGIQRAAREEALWQAVEEKKIYPLKTLFTAQLKPDINKRRYGGKTVLMLAAAQGSIDIARYLIEQGADVNIRDYDGMSALLYAAEQGHTKMAKLLIDAGAHINIQNTDGVSALILAASFGYADLVKLLVARGANLNLQDKSGKTALMRAIGEGEKKIAEFLITHGAGVALEDNDEVTALMYAGAQKNFDDIIHLLLSKDPSLQMKPIKKKPESEEKISEECKTVA